MERPQSPLTFPINHNGRLQPQDVAELEHMVIIPMVLKKEMYRKKTKLMFQIQYSIDTLNWEWSIESENNVCITSRVLR